MEEGEAYLVSGSKLGSWSGKGASMLIPRSSTTKKDPQGNEHLLMHFNVEGPRNKGVANMHLVKRAGRGEYEYRHFYVDVRGQQRIYLENADVSAKVADSKRKKTTLFGIKWA